MAPTVLIVDAHEGFRSLARTLLASAIVIGAVALIVTLAVKPVDQAFKPFCSKRCADIDLNRWLSGVYAVPVKEDEDEDGARPAEGEPGEKS